jgi:hypothetical protein
MVCVHYSAETYLRSIEDQARTLDQLGALAEAGSFDQAIVPASQLQPQFPNATVDALTVTQIRQAQNG